jgi:PKD repeat protein
MHTYTVSGNYQVSLTASNECNSQTSVQTVSAATSVANALESAVINVYPNPSTGLFFLEVSGAEQAVNISIENIQGQVVYEGVNTGNRMELDIRNQSAGVYMLHLSNEQGRVVRKLIVQ